MWGTGECAATIHFLNRGKNNLQPKYINRNTNYLPYFLNKPHNFTHRFGSTTLFHIYIESITFLQPNTTNWTLVDHKSSLRNGSNISYHIHSFGEITRFRYGQRIDLVIHNISPKYILSLLWAMDEGKTNISKFCFTPEPFLTCTMWYFG